MILFILLTIIVSFIIICLISERFIIFFKIFSFILTFFIFFYFIILWLYFDRISNNFQYIEHFLWNDTLNIYYSIGVDGISILFLVLTSFLIPFCILYSWYQYSYFFKEFIVILLLIEFFLINFFSVLDLFFSSIFFEVILIPMFILIGNFGSRQRRIHASFQFFFYTMTGSFSMFLGILLVYLHEGSTDIYVYYYSVYNYKIQLLLWFFFFISLSVKIPLFPLHLWLPEAHVEAPTIGSVILAGILLKMGTYGLLRLVVPVFSFANFFYKPFIFLLTFLSIYYVSLITFCQIDLKKLIAYSSIAHMGYVTMSLFTFDFVGVQGSIFLMLSHGIVSSLLFFLVGMLYDRYKTRIIFFYKSLYSIMPNFCLILFIATLANIGFPGTISFIGEFLILFSFLKINKIIFFFNSLGFIISITYSFWLYNRVMSLSFIWFYIYSDLNKREFYIILPFVLLIFLFGFCPYLILDTLEFSILNLLLTIDINFH